MVREDAKLIRSQVERCRLILQRMSAEGAEPMGEAARTIRVAELLNEARCQLSEVQQDCVLIDVPDDDIAVVVTGAGRHSIASRALAKCTRRER